MKLLKDFIRGFKSYPLNAYDIGQLVAENLIWWVFGVVVGIAVYCFIKL